jgi:replication initiation protein RepC
VEGLPRTATRQQLEEAAEALSQLADDIRILLETQVKTTNMSANESQNERHIQNSNPEPPIDLEPTSERSGAGEPIVLHPEIKRAGENVFPLGMVLDACPDIVDYCRGGISNWRDLLAAASVVRSALGVSPSAWEEAQTILGEKSAAIVIAAILQRGAAITSAGGYLRELTRKAQVNAFSIGPMLMALISARQKRRA